MLNRPVLVRHYGLSAGLSEEGEGEDSSFPGLGAAGGGRQDRNPAVPPENPRDHQGCPAAKGLCAQVSHLKLFASVFKYHHIHVKLQS